MPRTVAAGLTALFYTAIGVGLFIAVAMTAEDFSAPGEEQNLRRALATALPGLLACYLLVMVIRRKAGEGLAGLAAIVLICTVGLAVPMLTYGQGSSNDFWAWLYMALPLPAGYAFAWTRPARSTKVEESYQRD